MTPQNNSFVTPDSIRDLINQKKYTKALSLLKTVPYYDLDFSSIRKFVKLLPLITHDRLPAKPLKIAILPTSTVDHFCEILKYLSALYGLSVDFYIAQFNTVAQEVFDADSSLYQCNPDIIWIFTSYRDLHWNIPPNASAEMVDNELASTINYYAGLWTTIKKKSRAIVIQNNFDVPPHRVFGNFEANAGWSRVTFIRKLNSKLTDSADEYGTTIFDLEHISSQFGKSRWCDDRFWYHSKHAFSLDATGCAAYYASRLLCSIKGLSYKCIVLDLDNTLWGGVIGDDGIGGIKLGSGADGEAFADFQEYLLGLKKRGVILAVCSKNEMDNAQLPFVKHPDTKLHLNDFAVFVANWNNKADNIKDIAATLEIGIDSVVFVDDNPAERALVRQLLPMVAVPEMPSDPSFFIKTLDQFDFFETITFSEEDKSRSDMYRQNAERKIQQKNHANLDEFLQSLEMVALIGDLDDIHLPRIAQLINKSNQFHCTTTRYTENQILHMVKQQGTICRFFKMRDHFGDNGLISAVLLKETGPEELYIDTWVMSCRVLSRTMEEFICNAMVSIAQEKKYRRIIGKYIPTAKNKLVSDLYKRLGFSLLGDNCGETTWALDLSRANLHLETFVSLVNNY